MRISKLLWAGLALLVLGSAPLVLVALFSRDPNPNPIGFGMLAMVTFWPALILIAFGLYRTWRLRSRTPGA